MSTVINLTEIEPLVLHLAPAMKNMTDDQFLEFCNLKSNNMIRLRITSEVVK